MDDEAQFRAMAQIAINLAVSILGMSILKGTISQAEVTTMLDNILTGFETADADDPTTQIARQLVEQIANSIARQ